MADDEDVRLDASNVASLYGSESGSDFRIISAISGDYILTMSIGILPAASLVAWFGLSIASSVCACCIAGWLVYIVADGAEKKEGRPNPEWSRKHWAIRWLREYFGMTLYHTAKVQNQLMAANPTGQAIFACFPHGVNSDFRLLLDGLLYDALPKVYEKSPARSLAASVLFKIPGVRQACLRSGCVDAGRSTAQHVLKKKYSVLVLPGGMDEQVETICGRERVYLKKRFGFLKLAIVHGIPVVPIYVFGSSDLYYTSRILHGLRKWLVRTFGVCIPIYWGRPGFLCYPTPLGFPLKVKQHVVFGNPLVFPQEENPSTEQIADAHKQFVSALTALFDSEKSKFGYADRTLEIL